MRITLILSFSLFLISCASGPGKRKGPSPYSASWVGETVHAGSVKDCPADQTYTKKEWKDLVVMAGHCVNAKNFFQVERIANYLAKVEPESHWGAYFLSLSAESKGDLPRAFWMTELALKKAPEDGILLYQRGRLQWEIKNHTLALNDLEESVRRSPTLAEAHLLLGQIRFTKDDLSGAHASFSKALGVDSKIPQAHFGLGEIAFKKKKYDEAFDHHKRAAKLDPRNGVSLLRIAQIQEIHFKDLPASLASYKDLHRRISLNRVDGKLPSDLSDKISSLNQAIQQSVAQTVSNREPSNKKVTK